MDDSRHPRIKELPFTVPENIHPDALLFLGDDTGRSRTFLGRVWIPSALFFGGVVTSLTMNKVMRRPYSATIYRTLMFGLIGGFGGEYLHGLKEKFISDRDLHTFHYICLHPEDFPPPKRVLYRDYLTSWIPMR